MVVVNIILLNMLWFASVLGAANGLLWPAAALLVILLTITFIYEGISKSDLKVIVVSVCCGIIIDGVLMSQGWVLYEYKAHDLPFMPPVWILMLWVGFGTSIKTGMQWLLNYPIMGGTFMLIGAPLSYFSATKLNAVVIPDLFQTMAFIGVCWLLYFILIVQISQSKESVKNVLV